MKVSDRELEEMHDEMINECSEPVNCWGEEFEPADVLKTMDPVAYRCSLMDYIDSMCIDEELFEGEDGNYYDSDPSERGE